MLLLKALAEPDDREVWLKLLALVAYTAIEELPRQVGADFRDAGRAFKDALKLSRGDADFMQGIETIRHKVIAHHFFWGGEGGTSISMERLSGHAPAPARAEAAGLDGTRITAHSLRAGHATAAALAGVRLDRTAAQTRHKDLGVLVNRYVRPLEALKETSSKDLGL